MYRCPNCWQDFLTRFEPCPGCSEQVTRHSRSKRARERRRAYDPVGQIEEAEFWALWRLYPCCPCCGNPWGQRDTISLDHIVPLSRGGPNTGENVQPLCQPCNLWKSDHIIYFDRHFPGRTLPLPPILIRYLEQPESSAQIDLFALPPDPTVRYPCGTARQLEQATLTLTHEAMSR